IELQNKIKKLNVDIKMVEPQNVHFTIKFLGEVSENEIEHVKKILREFIENEYAFSLEIGGIGYFGGSNFIRVIWLGVKKGEDELNKIIKFVNENVKIGKKENMPHLTIGRIKSGKNRDVLLKFIENNKNVKIGEFFVNEIKIKSSTLTSKGPIYEDIFKVCLKRREVL
ncbi:MAG: RNA 2',3'-cyclic phosphodiesterase, partial [Candidatus Nanoarchaeia archaeon]